MKTRRRVGVGAAGVAALLLTAPTTLHAQGGSSTHEVRALRDSDAAVIDLPAWPARVTPATSPATTTTTTTAPAAPPTPTAACPVQGPVSFIDSWGFRRSGGRRHEGVDMMAARGTPVAAPVAGTVTHRSNRLGGHSFYLLGDDGVEYYGTHMSAYGASGWVEAGTIIGYVGDTGNARGNPHLHFEIHPGGAGSPAVDPYPTVAMLCLAELSA